MTGSYMLRSGTGRAGLQPRETKTRVDIVVGKGRILMELVRVHEAYSAI